MKKLNVMLLAAVFAISSIASANTGKEPKKSETNFTKEVKTLLKKPSFKVENEIEARVTFTLNDEGEIVVLSVDSESDTVENFIKGRLNYQKVESKLDEDVKFFTMPVRVVAD